MKPDPPVTSTVFCPLMGASPIVVADLVTRRWKEEGRAASACRTPAPKALCAHVGCPVACWPELVDVSAGGRTAGSPQRQRRSVSGQTRKVASSDQKRHS